MLSYILFLNGTYNKRHLTFYKKQAHGKIKVAVDGGYKFFSLANLKPNFLIGDLDSVRLSEISSLSKTKVFKYPKEKNQTDFELALDFCLKSNAKDIVVVVPSLGDVDHFLGVVMASSFNEKIGDKIKLRIINNKFEMTVVNNTRQAFNNCVGKRVSVLALSDRISLTMYGFDYNAKNLAVKRGSGHALRNRIKNKKASLEISGKALVILSPP